MLCPLRKYQDEEAGDTLFYECLREKCAWWNSGFTDGVPGMDGHCAVLSIAGRLDDMLISGVPVNNHF